jgi:hypothetical protein
MPQATGSKTQPRLRTVLFDTRKLLLGNEQVCSDKDLCYNVEVGRHQYQHRRGMQRSQLNRTQPSSFSTRNCTWDITC